MPEIWEFYDKTKLKSEVSPSSIAVRAGFPIYDPKSRTPFPLYYGIVITRKQVQRNMMRDGINGGYSLLPRPDTKNSAFVTLIQTKDDYEKAIQYPHYARAIFEKADHKPMGYRSFEVEFPEIIEYKKGKPIKLINLVRNSVSLTDLAYYLERDTSEIIDIYVKSHKTSINT